MEMMLTVVGFVGVVWGVVSWVVTRQLLPSVLLLIGGIFGVMIPVWNNTTAVSTSGVLVEKVGASGLFGEDLVGLVKTAKDGVQRVDFTAEQYAAASPGDVVNFSWDALHGTVVTKIERRAAE